jgi:hypothetical protein
MQYVCNPGEKMSLVKKSLFLCALSFLTITPSFAQNARKKVKKRRPSKQAEKVIPCEAPMSISVKDSWDVYTSASFIYWNPYQENMELGIVSDTSEADIYTLNGQFIDLDFQYKPGFQIGLGTSLDHGNWDLFLQYTWFRSTQRENVSLDISGNEVLYPKWEIPDTTSPTYFAGNEHWRLQMDLLDFELGKDICITPVLSFHTFIGARAAWIRQRLKTEYLNETTGLLLNNNIFITQRTHSWGLGPRFGLKSLWTLGQGIRLFGNASGDLLFTQYTKTNIDQEATTTTGSFATSSRYHVTQKDRNYLRAHFALDLGFGWGTYLNEHRQHIDLSASYGFQIFFDQNMFRFFLDDQYLASSLSPNGNLTIHGLTTTLRFDF